MEARLMKTRFADLWTDYNCLLYVIDGSKRWHTANGSYDIEKDSCVFVRKGGFILEQLADSGFCVMLFFIPDAFICETLYPRQSALPPPEAHYEPVLQLHGSETLKGFFLSMSAYFSEMQEPDHALLELKFKELVLTIAANTANKSLLSYFCSLMHAPQTEVLKRVMDDNFCFNLTLAAYATLSNRSLSAFKRDFKKVYGCNPGQWLLEKRLQHAFHLINNVEKPVAAAAFQSGFQHPSHFSRSYRKRFGHTPKDHKKAVGRAESV